MKVFKCKIWAAIGSLMDHASYTTNNKSSSAAAMAAAPAPDRALLADIEAAVERFTTVAGAGGDEDRHVHEILFLVSNAPGAITFLSRRITARLESPSPAARSPPPPAAALQSLLLVHRLLRAADRYFEQDLRSLWASRDLRIDSPRCTCSPPPLAAAAATLAGAGGGEYAVAASATGACSFLHGYSAYLEERMQWAITQSGNLEPRPPTGAITGDPLVFKLAMSQRLLDLAIQLLPDNNTSAASGAARSAFGIVLRESFKVYGAFRDGLDALLRSTRSSPPLAAGAGEIIKKACAQTAELKEFYHKCKRSSSSSSKSLDYPVVRVVTSAAMDQLLLMPPPPVNDIDEESTAAAAAKESEPFATKLETTISTVWVEFDDGDDGDLLHQGVQQPSYR